MTIPYLVPTEQTLVKEVGKPENRRAATFQICDLFIPGKRNAVDYEHEIKDKPLEANVKHFLTGVNFIQPGPYGVKFNQYGADWIPEKRFYEEFSKLVKG